MGGPKKTNEEIDGCTERGVNCCAKRTQRKWLDGSRQLAGDWEKKKETEGLNREGRQLKNNIPQLCTRQVGLAQSL